MTGSEPTLREALLHALNANAYRGSWNSDRDTMQPMRWDEDDVVDHILAALPPAAPDADAVEACLAELAESPLPGARYAYNVVARRLRVETTT